MTAALQKKSVQAQGDAQQAAPDGPDAGKAASLHSEYNAPMLDLIELFFFSYRDFIGDADRLLEAYKFGRAHHRVLHFVYRKPGLTIAELLDILKITKQSLNRVLKELLEQSFVETRTGVADRRQRHLTVTPAGERLALDLAHLQSARFARVLAQSPAGAQQEATRFLLAMIDPGEQAKVAGLVWPNGRQQERTGDEL